MMLGRQDHRILLVAAGLALLFWANIGFSVLRPTSGSFLLKWLPTGLLAWLVFQHRSSPRSIWLFTGLLVQSLGAVILDFDRIGYVLYALAFTAVAHLCFAAAFAPTKAALRELPRVRWILAVVFLAYALSYGSFVALRAGTRGMTLPVLIYMLCLSAGALSALLSGRSWLAFAGMAMFVLDDTVFSYHLFVSPIPPNHFITWPTYFTGQVLITLGLVAGSDERERAPL